MAEETVNKSMVKVLSRRRPRWRAILALLVSCIVLLGLMVLLAYYYNSLVALRQDVRAARYQVDSAEQFRTNLFPELVEAVTTFVSHEDRVFDYTSDSRTQSVSRPSREEIEDLVKRSKTDWQDALSKIIAWAENYPELKTSDSFQTMMSKMAEVENEIFERRVAYNDAVNIYTTTCRSFPTNGVAFMFGFEVVPYYEVSGKPEWLMEKDESEKNMKSVAK